MRKVLICVVIMMLFLSGCSSKPFEPVVVQTTRIIDQNGSYDPLTFISDVEEAGLTFTVVNDGIDNTKPGEYEVVYKVALGSKSTEVTYKVMVKDYQGPEIEVDEQIDIPYGGTFVLLDNAKAVDEFDGDVSDSLHYTGVINAFAEGDYQIVVIASDQFENRTEKEITVSVKKSAGNSYASAIIGEYTDVTYADGNAPTLVVKEDGTFEMYLNNCSIYKLVEGKYKLYNDSIYLIPNTLVFANNQEDNVVRLQRMLDGSLFFASELNICAPNYGDDFKK